MYRYTLSRITEIAMMVLFIALIAGTLIFIVVKTINKDKYVYVARGAECQEFDREYNTLKKCTSGEVLGEFEIINPISIVKIRVENE